MGHVGFVWFWVLASARRSSDEQSHQNQDADDHSERVVINVARLKQPDAPAIHPTTFALPLIAMPSINPTSPPRHRPKPSLRAPPANTTSLMRSR